MKRHLFVTSIVVFVIGMIVTGIAVFQAKSFTIPGPIDTPDINGGLSIRLFGIGAAFMCLALGWWAKSAIDHRQPRWYQFFLAVSSLILLVISWVSYWQPGLMSSVGWYALMALPAITLLILAFWPVIRGIFVRRF